MGDSHQKQPLQSNEAATDVVNGSFSASNIIGKRTLTGDLNSPSGDQYIDHHALCERTSSKDCFLDSESRTALITDYKVLVMSAQDAYQRALLEIRMDELVKKDDDLPWVVTLLLDIVSAELLRGVTGALKQLKADKLAALTEAANLGADAARQATVQASTAYVALSMLSDERLSAMAKSSLDAGKKSPGSRTGGCYATIDAADVTSNTPCTRSSSSTTCAASYGTTLSVALCADENCLGT